MPEPIRIALTYIFCTSVALFVVWVFFAALSTLGFALWELFHIVFIAVIGLGFILGTVAVLRILGIIK